VYGAPIDDADVPKIVDYLTATYWIGSINRTRARPRGRVTARAPSFS